MRAWFNTVAGRLVVFLVLGILVGWGLSEIAFAIIAGDDRPPGRIELVIPAGTAARVAAGENPPDIPQDLLFVTGDVLVVRNEDSVSHQLGPLWVPPGSSASLNMQEPNRYSYACSFQTSHTFGLTVREEATLVTRLEAVALAGPPMGMLMALYSFVLWPLRPREKGGQPPRRAL
jgi:hypothetical protein